MGFKLIKKGSCYFPNAHSTCISYCFQLHQDTWKWSVLTAFEDLEKKRHGVQLD